MEGIFSALSSHFSDLFTDFLGCGEGDSAIIFENSDLIKRRYLDGGCEYTLNFKPAFRGFFGRDSAKNAENRAKQERLAAYIINGKLPKLPPPFAAMTLDVLGLTTDCIDVRSETARYCVDCRFTFFGEG